MKPDNPFLIEERAIFNFKKSFPPLLLHEGAKVTAFRGGDRAVVLITEVKTQIERRQYCFPYH